MEMEIFILSGFTFVCMFLLQVVILHLEGENVFDYTIPPFTIFGYECK